MGAKGDVAALKQLTGIKDKNGKVIYTMNKLRNDNGEEFLVCGKDGKFYLAGHDNSKIPFTDGSGFINISFLW